MKKVAIVGGGPAGLVSAKECLDNGMRPVIYERRNSHSGLWSSFKGAVWPDMVTNLSKENCRFPDHPWPAGTALFPNQRDVVRYLESYKEKFKLNEKADIRFNHAVTNIEHKDGQYHILSNGKSEIFSHVIVASGFFTKPYQPEISGIDDFKGDIEHGSTIKPFSSYVGRRILVVGNGFSGCDIVSGLAQAGANVTHLFRRAYQVLPRDFPDGQTIDSAFYQYQTEEQRNKEPLNFAKKNQEIRQYICDLFGDQGDVHPLIKIDRNAMDPVYVSIAEGYLEQVKEGNINLVKGEIKNINNKGEVCIGDDCHGVDNIIFATGFENDLTFLSGDILENMNYEQSDQFMPAPLHEGIWNSHYNDLAFVGMYRGPFFLILSLQAKWIAKAFSDPEKFKPSQEEIKEGVYSAMDLRNLSPRPQFPYGDYVSFVERLSTKLENFSFLDKAGQVVQSDDFSCKKPIINAP